MLCAMRTKAPALALLALALPGVTLPPSIEHRPPAPVRRFIALYADGVSSATARAALRDSGARVVDENKAIGLATVRAPADFVPATMATGAFYGIAHDRAIGHAVRPPSGDDVPPGRRPSLPSRLAKPASTQGDPLFGYQWPMRMVRATPRGSYSVERGDRRVLVGVMDTGIDLHNPDVRGRVDQDLSKSFLGDLPPARDHCQRHPKNRYCGNSPFTDTLGHGTAVGSLIAGAVNGFGMSGVAPKVSLVSLRTGRYYVFIEPVVDALTYAAKHGIDVVNMSFFVDPWLFNCPDNPADTQQQQMEQQTIVKAMQDAIDYARAHSVTPITALGNESIDLGKPSVDNTSPDYPPGKSYRRDVDNSCLVVPQETDGVIGISGLGPSERKAYYSNYGIERTDAAAPSGDAVDRAKSYPKNETLVAVSKLSLKKADLIDSSGKPTSRDVLRRCRRPGHRKCAYYRFWEGTSFAAPVATGVAALIVSRAGTPGGNGLKMDPSKVEAKLLATATPHACPKGGVQHYHRLGPKYTARCEHRPGGGNGFYGAGIVDALRAARRS